MIKIIYILFFYEILLFSTLLYAAPFPATFLIEDLSGDNKKDCGDDESLLNRTKVIPSFSQGDDGSFDSSVSIVFDTGYCDIDDRTLGHRTAIGIDFGGIPSEADIEKLSKLYFLSGGDIDLFYSGYVTPADEDSLSWGALHIGYGIRYSLITTEEINPDLTTGASGFNSIDVDTEILSPSIGLMLKIKGGPSIAWSKQHHIIQGRDDNNFADYISHESPHKFSITFPIAKSKQFIRLDRVSSISGDNGLVAISFGAGYGFLDGD